MKEEQPTEIPKKIIIGNDDIWVYAFPILYAFENATKIELSAIGNNINMMERLVKMYSNLGVDEINRRKEKFKDTTALIITLKRKS